VRLYVATEKAGKIRELRAIFGDAGVELLRFAAYRAPAEGDASYAENAALKARSLAQQLADRRLRVAVLGDDSGLEVAALGRAPGILSARSGGENATWAERRRSIIAALAATGSQDRSATFVCALHLIKVAGSEIAVERSVEGRIADIRDRERIASLIAAFKPNLVFHAAALKHVPILERDWEEGIKTNVFGSVNVADAALNAGADAMVMISTDKAIDPVSILVADFDNRTGDAVFDGALEQPLSIAMEGASFITAYPRRDAQRLAQTLGGATRLDAAAARPVSHGEIRLPSSMATRPATKVAAAAISSVWNCRKAASPISAVATAGPMNGITLSTPAIRPKMNGWRTPIAQSAIQVATATMAL